MSLLSIATIQPFVESGHVAKKKHPDADLFLFNYTARTQYDRLWNDVTRSCRGLILGSDGAIVARPFPKFFNLHEHGPDDLPMESFQVTEKLDGSLGILYWIGDEPFIATRGSFTSSQAHRATLMLKVEYAGCIPYLKRDRTYLFEIIYPDNRIVVDYGDTEGLVLLDVLDNETGLYFPRQDIGFPMAALYDGLSDVTMLKSLARANSEGFVVRFNSGFRIKVKFDEYVRLHRLITTVSNKTIWELLKEGSTVDELLDHVPDEFFAWVRKTASGFEMAYVDIEFQALKDFRVLGSRKETALYFQTRESPSVLFAMLDEKPYGKHIWKKLRPKYERPYVFVNSEAA